MLQLLFQSFTTRVQNFVQRHIVSIIISQFVIYV